MWGKIFNPYAYSGLGMRENTYLVAALLLMGVVTLYFVQNVVGPWLEKNHRGLLCVAESGVFAVAVPLVIVFLRPITQFIYFQF